MPLLIVLIRFSYAFQSNPVGRRVKETKAFCCLHCQHPVLLVGRLVSSTVRWPYERLALVHLTAILDALQARRLLPSMR